MMTKFSSPSYFGSVLYFKNEYENAILPTQIKQANSPKSIFSDFRFPDAIKGTHSIFFFLSIILTPEIKKQRERSSQ